MITFEGNSHSRPLTATYDDIWQSRPGIIWKPVERQLNHIRLMVSHDRRHLLIFQPHMEPIIVYHIDDKNHNWSLRHFVQDNDTTIKLKTPSDADKI